MRPARILSAVLALALLGLLPFSLSPADAVSRTTQHPAVATATAKSVGAKIVKKRHGLYMVGQVRPPQGPVIISRATKCNKRTATCNFKHYRTVKLMKKGRFSVKVQAPKHGNLYWQAHVGSHKSAIWETCKTVTGSCY